MHSIFQLEIARTVAEAMTQFKNGVALGSMRDDPDPEGIAFLVRTWKAAFPSAKSLVGSSPPVRLRPFSRGAYLFIQTTGAGNQRRDELFRAGGVVQG